MIQVMILGEPTTKKMPLTGASLSGKDTYKKILYYFTTNDISPEQINSEGEKQLNFFYNQVNKGLCRGLILASRPDRLFYKKHVAEIRQKLKNTYRLSLK